MTPEELVDDFLAHLTFDDAYVDHVAKAMGTMSIEDFVKLLDNFDKKYKNATPEQKTSFQQLNQALAKKPEFNKAIKRFHAWKEAQPLTTDASKPRIEGHSNDASGKYNTLIAKITDKERLRFIGDMNRANLVVYLLCMHGDQDVIPAVEIREPAVEERVRAATTVVLTRHGDYIYPEWMPAGTP